MRNMNPKVSLCCTDDFHKALKRAAHLKFTNVTQFCMEAVSEKLYALNDAEISSLVDKHSEFVGMLQDARAAKKAPPNAV